MSADDDSGSKPPFDPTASFVGDYYGELNEEPSDPTGPESPTLLRSLADPSGAEEPETDILPLRWIAGAILIGSINLYVSWGLHHEGTAGTRSSSTKLEFDPATAGPPEPRIRSSPDPSGDVDFDSTPAETVPDSAPRVPDKASRAPDGVLEDLIARNLLIPVGGIEVDELRDSYEDPRSGQRQHLAIDIMAERNRKVLAVENGTIERLFRSNLGGITLYLRSADGHFIYYYAHLERYARGLEAGQTVERGDVVGFVGSSGNAPDSAPHLHFAIHLAPGRQQTWTGDPINPYPAFVHD